MSEEATAGLGNEPASTKLDSLLSENLKNFGDDAPVETEAAPPEQEASSDPKVDKTGRAHGQDGKFVAKQKDSAAEASQEPAEAASAEVQQQKPEPAQQPIEPPARWTEADKAKFAAWPRDVQESVSERYKAIEADYTRKTQEAAEIRRNAEPILQAIEPFKDYLAQLQPVVGQTPDQMIKSLLTAEYQLRNGSPEQKYTALRQICGTYGVDLAALASGNVPRVDPAFQQLHQELSELRNWRTQQEALFKQQQDEQAKLHIDAFANAKNEAGRPKYPHYERVRAIMGNMMANGEAATLEQAYQKAAEPIEAAIAEGLRQREQNSQAQRAEAVAKAQKAAPVRSTGSQPGGSAKGKDLDSLLNDAMAKAGMS